jgi:5-methylcytosine-specific restriction endonuclease McrA
MPIKPENRAKYGPEWKAIRQRILTRAGHACEGSASYPDCRAADRQAHPVTGSKVVLTIAHLDQDPANHYDANLKAMCQRCHFATDAPFNRAKAARTRAANAEARRPKTLMEVFGALPDDETLPAPAPILL